MFLGWSGPAGQPKVSGTTAYLSIQNMLQTWKASIVWPDKLCQAKHREDKKYIYLQTAQDQHNEIDVKPSIALHRNPFPSFLMSADIIIPCPHSDPTNGRLCHNSPLSSSRQTPFTLRGNSFIRTALVTQSLIISPGSVQLVGSRENKLPKIMQYTRWRKALLI